MGEMAGSGTLRDGGQRRGAHQVTQHAGEMGAFVPGHTQEESECSIHFLSLCCLRLRHFPCRMKIRTPPMF